MLRGETVESGLAVGSHSITVHQWNILASELAKSSPTSNFFKTPAEDLTFEVRSKRVVEHVQARNADIVCLEELDKVKEFYEEAITQLGYDMVYLPKTKDTIPGFRDGTGIFFKKDKFSLAKTLKIEFTSNIHAYKQVCLGLQLKHTASDKHVNVFATHLKAKAEFGEWRKDQAEQLLAKLGEWEKETDAVGTIVCGDFNAFPDDAAVQAMIGAKFQRVYTCNSAIPKPAFTSWAHRPTGSKQVTIDYIFYRGNKQSFGPVSYEKLPGEAEIGPAALPCAKLPSDHLPLFATFSWN